MLYELLRIIFTILFKIVFRVEVRGTENLPKEGRVILAANHMSNMDPPLVATFLPRPVSYMAKKELFEVPIFKNIITACHAFPVKRGAADRGAIKAAIQVLKQEKVLGVFPEGTRSRNGKLRKAESGVALLAAMSGAPVLPAAIIGTDKIFANGGFLPKLKVIYGKPMYFQGEKGDRGALEKFTSEIMTEIGRMKESHS